VLGQTVDYADETHSLMWNSSAFGCSPPSSPITIDQHGIYLSLGGFPANPEEQSCVGVTFESVSGRITYAQES